MKYAIIITDGAADIPLEELDKKTPLEVAAMPNSTALASRGQCGTVQTVPGNMPPGSDVAIMSLLGNNPLECYTGRAPIEAAARGITLEPEEWAFRCNLVTISGNIMKDHSAGNISTREAEILMDEINKRLRTKAIRFYSGVSYRNLMIIKGEFQGTTTPPHDILDKQIDSYLPTGKGSNILRKLITSSREFLPDHPVNRERKASGKNRASSVWFWGEGKAPEIKPFFDKYGIRGTIIAAVDLVRGLGRLMGWKVVDVPGATGYFDTNYQGKGEAAVKALGDSDIIAVHIEAPDEAGHAGKPGEKIKALEQIDTHIIGPVYSYLSTGSEPWRILIMPDHPTPSTIRTHTREPVPFVIAGSDVESNGCSGFTEKEAKATGLFVDAGYKIMDMLVK
jgi:2,3-bisphosphoglycerate-independent phosphoglycerate mutase